VTRDDAATILNRMAWTSAESTEQNKITITFQTEGSGYIVADQAPLRRLSAYLRSARLEVSPTRDATAGLCSIDFVSLEQPLRDAVQKWPELQSHRIEFQSTPRA
jgi:hypothetical protein